MDQVPEESKTIIFATLVTTSRGRKVVSGSHYTHRMSSVPLVFPNYTSATKCLTHVFCAPCRVLCAMYWIAITQLKTISHEHEVRQRFLDIYTEGGGGAEEVGARCAGFQTIQCPLTSHKTYLRTSDGRVCPREGLPVSVGSLGTN